MNTDVLAVLKAIAIGTACLGFAAQGVALLIVFLKGGHMIGTMQAVDKQLLEDVKGHENVLERHSVALNEITVNMSRVVSQLTGLEQRVGYLEHPR